MDELDELDTSRTQSEVDVQLLVDDGTRILLRVPRPASGVTRPDEFMYSRQVLRHEVPAGYVQTEYSPAISRSSSPIHAEFIHRLLALARYMGDSLEWQPVSNRVLLDCGWGCE